MHNQDAAILRELACRYAEIAALPVNARNRGLWIKLNGLRPERPMVAIDQICWNEMDTHGQLALRCQDPLMRSWETFFRQTLYRWEHFPVDMVVDDTFTVTKVVSNSSFGINTLESALSVDQTNDVYSHAYHNQFESIDDVEKIRTPVVAHDTAETERRLQLAHALFDGILKVEVNGITPYLSIWDPIAQWMGMQNALYALADEPEMMHAIVDRMVAGYHGMLDQMEALGVLEHHQPLIHCTGAWTDELPKPGFSADRPRLDDMWMFGLAQMFCSCAPAMFDEYEIEPCLSLFKRFGLVYYGCCDPLDGKMEQVRKIPNLRKVSMSPWANKQRGAAAIGHDYVFSCKPNPSYLGNAFDEAVIRRDLLETKRICAQEGCALEFILKDISTVGREPERLWRWAQIAMEVAQG